MSKQKKSSKVNSFFADFKKFITQGNILDLAVAVVIGAAFGKIVTSLVNDIIMPLISLLVGGKSVADWKYIITAAEYDAEGILTKAESAIYYGNFIQTIIDFLIIAFFIFIALRVIMRIKNRLVKQDAGEVIFDKKECKAITKQLKAEGKNKAEIAEIIKQKEADATAAKKAEEAAKAAAEEASKPESTEQLLAQIRDLLATQSK